jgi:GNAT superfamily N-acetyltransferase
MDDGSPAVIVYSTAAPVDPAALDTLCAAVGWPPRPAPAVAAALAGSYLVASLLLRPAAGAGGGGATLVGLARATSDGAFNATIWDVLVHPAWQGRGLGKDLVERVAATLLDAGISTRRGIMCAHLEPAHSDLPQRRALPQSERAQARRVLLPLFPGMTSEQQVQVVTALRQAIDRGRTDD